MPARSVARPTISSRFTPGKPQPVQATQAAQEQQQKAVNQPPPAPAPTGSGLGANIATIELTPQATSAGFTKQGNDIIFGGVVVATSTAGVLTPTSNVVQQPIYGTVSGQNQMLGTISYIPSVSNNQLNLVFKGFSPGNVTVSWTQPSSQSPSGKVGYSVPADVTYNPTTGRAIITPQALYGGQVLPPAPTTLSPTVLTIEGTNVPLFNIAGIGVATTTILYPTGASQLLYSGFQTPQGKIVSSMTISQQGTNINYTVSGGGILGTLAPTQPVSVTLFGKTYTGSMTSYQTPTGTKSYFSDLPTSITTEEKGVQVTYTITYGATGTITATPSAYSFVGGGTKMILQPYSVEAVEVLRKEGFTGVQIGSIFSSNQPFVQLLNPQTGQISIASASNFFGTFSTPSAQASSYLSPGIKPSAVSGSYTISSTLPGQLTAGTVGGFKGVSGQTYQSFISGIQTAELIGYSKTLEPAMIEISKYSLPVQIAGVLGYSVGQLVTALPIAAVNPQTYETLANPVLLVSSLRAQAQSGILGKAEVAVQVLTLGLGVKSFGEAGVNYLFGNPAVARNPLYQPLISIEGELAKPVKSDVIIEGNKVVIEDITKEPLLTTGSIKAQLNIPIVRGAIGRFITTHFDIQPKEVWSINLLSKEGSRNFLVNQKTAVIDLTNYETQAYSLRQSAFSHTEVSKVTMLNPEYQGSTIGYGTGQLIFGKPFVEEAASAQGQLIEAAIFRQKLGAGVIIKPLGTLPPADYTAQISQASESTGYFEAVKQGLEQPQLMAKIKPNPAFVVEEAGTATEASIPKASNYLVVKFASFPSKEVTTMTYELSTGLKELVSKQEAETFLTSEQVGELNLAREEFIEGKIFGQQLINKFSTSLEIKAPKLAPEETINDVGTPTLGAYSVRSNEIAVNSPRNLYKSEIEHTQFISEIEDTLRHETLHAYIAQRGLRLSTFTVEETGTLEALNYKPAEIKEEAFVRQATELSEAQKSNILFNAKGGNLYQSVASPVVKLEDLVTKETSRITVGKNIQSSLNKAEVEGRLAMTERTYKGQKYSLSKGFSETNPLGVRVDIQAIVREAPEKVAPKYEAPEGEEYSTTSKAPLGIPAPETQMRLSSPESSGIKFSKWGQEIKIGGMTSRMQTLVEEEIGKPEELFNPNLQTQTVASTILMKQGAKLLEAEKLKGQQGFVGTLINPQIKAIPMTDQVSKQMFTTTQTSKQTQRMTQKQTQNQMNQQVQNQVSNQVSKQISNQVSKQVQNQIQEQVQEQIQEQVQTQTQNQIVEVPMFKVPPPNFTFFPPIPFGRRKPKKTPKDMFSFKQPKGVDYSESLTAHELGLKPTQSKQYYKRLGIGIRPAFSRRLWRGRRK
jgi:hypothetical protein